MLQLLAVGLGGSVGAISRWVLTGLVHRTVSPQWFPAGTLAVNVLGCLLIGGVMTLVTTRQLTSQPLQLFLVTGILGSLTTFSTFGFDTISLIREDKPALALAYVLANLVVGLLAVAAGIGLIRLVLR